MPNTQTTRGARLAEAIQNFLYNEEIYLGHSQTPKLLATIEQFFEQEGDAPEVDAETLDELRQEMFKRVLHMWFQRLDPESTLASLIIDQACAVLDVDVNSVNPRSSAS